MKVGLVFSTTYAFSRKYDWESRFIVHGLAYVLEMTRKQGIPCDLIDMRRCKDWADYLDRIKDYDILGFNIMSTEASFSEKVIRYTKKKNPKCKIIIGGLDPTVLPSRWENNELVDCMLQGEGELGFPYLVKKLMNNEVIPKLYRHPETIDVNQIPFVTREEWDEEFPWGLRMWSGKHRFYTMMTSRACVYRCKFCAPASFMVFGKGMERRRDHNNVMDEIRFLKEKGMESWMIHDDNFAQNKAWVHQFMDLYNAEYKPMPLIIQARVNVMKDEELVKRMKDVLGLEWAIIGFESFSDRVLKYLNKNATAKMGLEAAANCHKYGVKVFANVMLGVPTETNKEALETLEGIKKIRPTHLSPTTYMPYPGSYLYAECKKKGWILSEEGNRYANAAKIKGIDYEFLKNVINQMYQYQTSPQEELQYQNDYELNRKNKSVDDTIDQKDWEVAHHV